MSSSGHVESTVEEADTGSGGGCEVEPRVLHAAGGGGTGGDSIDNDSLPPIVVVVSMDESSSKSAILLNSPSSAAYEIGLPQLNNTSCSSDSGDSNSQESIRPASSSSINIYEGNVTPSELHDPYSFKNEIEIEKKELIFPTPQDSPSEKELVSISLSPDTLNTEANVSSIFPHPDVEDDSDDSPSSNPASATTNLDYTAIELPDTKESIDELCPVCGDKVSGYHYGLLTCESCKGFFKRTVQNKKVYTCVADRSCQIDKTQRKRCPFCRFNKCLTVGMKLEAVRADRMRGGRNKFGPMYKRDRARKMQMMRQRQISHQGLLTSRGGSSSAIGITYSTAYSTSSPIKEEIQSPFLSSSTSSPDSSPAPMAGVGALLQPIGATLAVSPSGANATIMGGQELSLWVGNVPAGAPGPPTGGGGIPGGGGGSSSGNAAGNGASRVSIASGAGSGVLALNSSGARGNGGGATDALSSRVPPLVRQLMTHIDDLEWQSSLYSLLQNQTYNQCEVDLFELLCKVLDQNLFSQVDWARNSHFFKDLRVDDQMKLLQHSWSDMLIIDHLHHRMHNKLQDEMQLPNGQKFDLLSLALLGTTQFADRFQHVMDKLSELKFDVGDYICLKFIMLLNPETRNLNDPRSVSAAHEQVKQTLIELCHNLHPNEQNRFQRLMDLIPELHYIADNGERYLYFKHINGAAPSQTLLMEMLHTKRR